MICGSGSDSDSESSEDEDKDEATSFSLSEFDEPEDADSCAFDVSLIGDFIEDFTGLFTGDFFGDFLGGVFSRSEVCALPSGFDSEGSLSDSEEEEEVADEESSIDDSVRDFDCSFASVLFGEVVPVSFVDDLFGCASDVFAWDSPFCFVGEDSPSDSEEEDVEVVDDDPCVGDLLRDVGCSFGCFFVGVSSGEPAPAFTGDLFGDFVGALEGDSARFCTWVLT